MIKKTNSLYPYSFNDNGKHNTSILQDNPYLEKTYSFNLVHFQDLQKSGWVKFLNKSSFFDFSIDKNSYFYKQNYLNHFYNRDLDNTLVDKDNSNLRTVFTHFFINKKQNLTSYTLRDSIKENLSNNNLLLTNSDSLSKNILSLNDILNNLHNNDNNIKNSIQINKDTSIEISEITQKNEISIMNTFKEYNPYTLVLGLAVVISGKIKKKNRRKTVHKRKTGSFSKIYHTQSSQYTARNKVGSFTIKVSICQAFLDSPRKQFMFANSKLSHSKFRIWNMLKLKNAYASSHMPFGKTPKSKKSVSNLLFGSPRYALFKKNYYKK